MKAFNKSFFLFLVLVFLISVGIGCKQDRSSAIEKQRIDSDSILPLPVSIVAVPLRYELHYFEQWLNEMIRGKFLDKVFTVNDERDSLWLQLERSGRIRLAIRNQKILIDVPVKATGTYKATILGIGIKNRNAVDAELLLKLEVDARLNEQWKLVTVTSLDTIIWQTDPNIRIAGINIDLKNRINRIFIQKEDEFLKRLDAVFFKEIDLRKVIGKVWHDLQKPIYLVKRDPYAWLLLQPQTVTGKVLLNDPSALVFDLAIEMTARAKVFEIDSSFERTLLPDLKLANTSNTFDFVIQGSIPYDKTALHIQKLMSETPISAKGYSVMIDSVELFGTSNGLAVCVDFTGDMDGRVYVQGTPVYNPETKMLEIEQFDYQLHSESFLVSATMDFLYDQIIDRVSDYLYIDLEDHISTLPDLITYSIDTGKVGDKLSLFFDTLNILEVEVLVSGKDLYFNVHTSGRARLDLQRLDVKRRIFITD